MISNNRYMRVVPQDRGLGAGKVSGGTKQVDSIYFPQARTYNGSQQFETSQPFAMHSGASTQVQQQSLAHGSGSQKAFNSTAAPSSSQPRTILGHESQISSQLVGHQPSLLHGSQYCALSQSQHSLGRADSQTMAGVPGAQETPRSNSHQHPTHPVPASLASRLLQRTEVAAAPALNTSEALKLVTQHVAEVLVSRLDAIASRLDSFTTKTEMHRSFESFSDEFQQRLTGILTALDMTTQLKSLEAKVDDLCSEQKIIKDGYCQPRVVMCTAETQMTPEKRPSADAQASTGPNEEGECASAGPQADNRDNWVHSTEPHPSDSQPTPQTRLPLHKHGREHWITRSGKQLPSKLAALTREALHSEHQERHAIHSTREHIPAIRAKSFTHNSKLQLPVPQHENKTETSDSPTANKGHKKRKSSFNGPRATLKTKVKLLEAAGVSTPIARKFTARQDSSKQPSAAIKRKADTATTIRHEKLTNQAPAKPAPLSHHNLVAPPVIKRAKHREQEAPSLTRISPPALLRAAKSYRHLPYVTERVPKLPASLSTIKPAKMLSNARVEENAHRTHSKNHTAAPQDLPPPLEAQLVASESTTSAASPPSPCSSVVLISPVSKRAVEKARAECASLCQQLTPELGCGNPELPWRDSTPSPVHMRARDSLLNLVNKLSTPPRQPMSADRLCLQDGHPPPVRVTTHKENRQPHNSHPVSTPPDIHRTSSKAKCTPQRGVGKAMQSADVNKNADQHPIEEVAQVPISSDRGRRGEVAQMHGDDDLTRLVSARRKECGHMRRSGKLKMHENDRAMIMLAVDFNAEFNEL